MSTKKKLNELQTKPLTDEQYADWKNSYNDGDPIPDSIHEYVKQILLPKTDRAIDKWDNLSDVK